LAKTRRQCPSHIWRRAKLIVRRVGKVYVLTNRLAEAATAILTATAVEGRTFVPADLPRSSRFIHLVDHLPEGAYLAVLERSPFWDAGTRVVERDSFHVVIGWIDGQP